MDKKTSQHQPDRETVRANEIRELKEKISELEGEIKLQAKQILAMSNDVESISNH